MSNFENLSDVMGGHNPHQELLKQTRKLVGKWEPTGLLDGIDDSTKKTGMAVLLENQATQLIKEASATGTGGDKEEWSGVALPLVRRIFGELAAQEFVSVQPMNLPSGLIFFLDFKYGTADQTQHAENSDVFGNTSASNADASGGLYGAGKFGYSINDQSVTDLNAKANGNATTASAATWKDVDFEPDLSSSVSDGTLKKLQVGAGLFTRPDWNGVRAFEVTGSGVSAVYPAYTVVDDVNNVTTASFFFKDDGTEDELFGIRYHQAPTATNRGDFEATTTQIDANPETDIDIPEIDIIETPTKLGDVERVSLKETRPPGEPVSVSDLNSVLRELNSNLASLQDLMIRDFPKLLLKADMTANLLEPCEEWAAKLKVLSEKTGGYLFSPIKAKNIEDEFQRAFPTCIEAHPLRTVLPLVLNELSFHRQVFVMENKWSPIEMDFFVLLRQSSLPQILENLQEMGSLLWNSVYNGQRLCHSLEILGIRFDDASTLRSTLKQR